MLFYEAVLIGVSLVIIAFSLFMSTTSALAHSENISLSAPTLPYKFPSVFVNTFISMELTDEDKETFFQDTDSEYHVSDLLWLDSEESKAKVLEYRLDYLESIKELNDEDLFDDFNDFSGERITEDNVLSFSFNDNRIPNLDDYVEENNYFYYIKTQNGGYTSVYFREGSR